VYKAQSSVFEKPNRQNCQNQKQDEHEKIQTLDDVFSLHSKLFVIGWVQITDNTRHYGRVDNE